MSHTISVTLGDNGPATGATVTLSDPAAAYGIRRASDNLVVVAAGAALTHAGGGVYTYPFGLGVAGTAYEAKIKIAWGDGSIDYVDDLFTVATTSATGYFGDIADVMDEGGKKNVITYSNLDGRKDSPDYVRLMRVMAKIDARIFTYIKANFIPKPVPGSDGFGLLTQAWALWVLARIYNARGDLDVQNDSQGEVSSAVWDREARRLLQLYVTQKRSANITLSFAIG